MHAQNTVHSSVRYFAPYSYSKNNDIACAYTCAAEIHDCSHHVAATLLRSRVQGRQHPPHVKAHTLRVNGVHGGAHSLALNESADGMHGVSSAVSRVGLLWTGGYAFVHPLENPHPPAAGAPPRGRGPCLSRYTPPCPTSCPTFPRVHRSRTP